MVIMAIIDTVACKGLNPKLHNPGSLKLLSAVIGFRNYSNRMNIEWRVGDHDLLWTASLICRRSTFLLWLLWSNLCSFVLDCCPISWPLHLKFPHLCKRLCRLMARFMQIPFLQLMLEALKGRWALTFLMKSYTSSQRLSHNCYSRCYFCGSQKASKMFPFF